MGTFHFLVPFYVSLLYCTAICVALLLQIVTPFLPEIPERLKLCTHKAHCVEITGHLLIFLFCYVSLYYNTDVGYIIREISGTMLVLFLLFSFVLILALAFLIRIFNNNECTKVQNPRSTRRARILESAPARILKNARPIETHSNYV